MDLDSRRRAAPQASAPYRPSAPTGRSAPTRPLTPPPALGRRRRCARRTLDLTVGLVGLVLLTPVFLGVALLVRVTGRGPVLFRQERVGEGGRPFTLYKFRSMHVNPGGSELTEPDDPRVTLIGRWLRATSLDELPQLLNLLRGDMTLVGPRPETPGLAARYPRQCRWVLGCRPGLTGPVQLRAGELASAPPGTPDPESYYLTVLVPRRAALDAEHLAASTTTGDLAVLLRTARHLLALRHPG